MSNYDNHKNYNIISILYLIREIKNINKIM